MVASKRGWPWAQGRLAFQACVWRFHVDLMGMGWGSSLNWLGLWVFVGLEGFRKRGVCGEKVFVVGIVWDLVGIAGTGT